MSKIFFILILAELVYEALFKKFDNSVSVHRKEFTIELLKLYEIHF